MVVAVFLAIVGVGRSSYVSFSHRKQREDFSRLLFSNEKNASFLDIVEEIERLVANNVGRSINEKEFSLASEMKLPADGDTATIKTAVGKVLADIAGELGAVAMVCMVESAERSLVVSMPKEGDILSTQIVKFFDYSNFLATIEHSPSWLNRFGVAFSFVDSGAKR